MKSGTHVMGYKNLKRQSFNYLQTMVALALIAFGAFLLMTGTAMLAAVVSTVGLMMLFAHFLFGRKPRRTDDKKSKPNATNGP